MKSITRRLLSIVSLLHINCRISNCQSIYNNTLLQYNTLHSSLLPFTSRTMASSTTATFNLSLLSTKEINQRYQQCYLEHHTSDDWVSQLDLSHINVDKTNPVKVLILYGSLRATSKSRLCAYEFARILYRLNCDVRVYNPSELPVRSDTHDNHPAVAELRQLSEWSDAHIWVSPEQHGAITGVMKNQIDHIPLSIGSVRPTQGKCLAVAQVCYSNILYFVDITATVHHV